MKCHTCHRKFSNSELKQKAKQKSDKIKAAIALAKLNGVQIGAKRKYDREKINELRRLGFSIKKIAKELGCSITPVTDTLKELKP